jgi:hypothetical protein
MRLKKEIDADIKIFSGDAIYTLEDWALHAEYFAKVLDSNPIRKMGID